MHAETQTSLDDSNILIFQVSQVVLTLKLPTHQLLANKKIWAKVSRCLIPSVIQEGLMHVIKGTICQTCYLKLALVLIKQSKYSALHPSLLPSPQTRRPWHYLWGILRTSLNIPRLFLVFRFRFNARSHERSVYRVILLTFTNWKDQAFYFTQEMS